jgi:hypothetical protein
MFKVKTVHLVMNSIVCLSLKILALVFSPPKLMQFR